MSLRDYQKAAATSVVDWLRYKPLERAIVVIPTAGGKSWIIKELAEWGTRLGKRVLILADRKELLEQTGEKLDGNVGYYSASIGEKRLDCAITVAGIQSLDAYLGELPRFDLILIDECDLVPPGDDSDDAGRYWRLLNSQPQASVVGFTATPWRTREGKLTWGSIVYEIGYAPLMAAGYLAPLSNKLLADVQPDLSSVEVKLGDYVTGQLDKVMESPELLAASVKAILTYKRTSHLIFAVSLRHASLLFHALIDNGLSADDVAMVSGETPKAEREEIVERFKSGGLAYLINCELFLRGFDAPRTDAIFCLRPTKSKTLWEQLCGRGVRISPETGKVNCLLIDMSGNLAEHGALGSPFTGKGAAKGARKAVGKICPECEEYVAFTHKECPDCLYQWPEIDPALVNHNLTPNTTDDAVYASASVVPSVLTHEVESVSYSRHKGKNGKPDTLKVSYHCNYGKYGSIAEWWSVAENANEFARQKAEKQFKLRGHELGAPIHTYSWDDLLWHAEQMKCPLRITVEHGEFNRILSYDYIPKAASIEELLGDEIPLTWETDTVGASHD